MKWNLIETFKNMFCTSKNKNTCVRKSESGRWFIRDLKTGLEKEANQREVVLHMMKE